MIKSMTGYGRREGAWKGRPIAVEVRAVNHRFCEVVVRAPKALAPWEDHFKRAVLRRVQRGRVELGVSFQGSHEGVKSLSLDQTLARQYYRALLDLKKQLRLPGTIDLAMLTATRDLIAVTEQPVVQDQALQRAVVRLLTGALSDLDEMRRREGSALDRDIKTRLRDIATSKHRTEQRMPHALKEYHTRMKTRIDALLGDRSPDPDRLNQELAFFADRCDITEELIRLGSHLTQFGSTLASREPVGRTLDFLLQEMGREVNTIGSKANDAEISIHVVKIKGELEKIREQVQNIE